MSTNTEFAKAYLQRLAGGEENTTPALVDTFASILGRQIDANDGELPASFKTLSSIFGYVSTPAEDREEGDTPTSNSDQGTVDNIVDEVKTEDGLEPTAPEGGGTDEDTFSLTASADQINEGASNTFTVTASEPVAEDTEVTFQLAVDGESASLEDFNAGSFNPVTVTIPAGETEATFDVESIAADGTEASETYRVEAVVNGETLSQQVTLLDGAEGAGQTFQLTKDLDIIPGMEGSNGNTVTSGDDTIIGVMNSATGSTDTTLNATDIIDAGEGQDTLRVVVAGDQGTALATNFENVETVRVESSEEGVLTSDVSAVDGVENLNITKAAGEVDAAAAATTDIDASFKEAGDLSITGGNNVNVNLTDVANNGLIEVGANTGGTLTALDEGAAAGDVTVETTGAAYVAGSSPTLSAIEVTGGQTVSVTQNATSDGSAAATDAGAGTITQGDVTIVADANTTAVDVKQDAAVDADDAANTTGGVTETASVKFGALKAGNSLTLDPDDTGTAANLVFTASEDMSAEDVAAAFANLVNQAAQGTVPAGDTQSAGVHTDGTYTGNSSLWTSGAANGDTVEFTSTTANTDVANLGIAYAANGGGAGVAPTVTTTAGKAHDATLEGGVMGVEAGTVDITNEAALKTVNVDGFSATGSSATGSIINGGATALETLTLKNGGAFTNSNAAATLALNLENIEGTYTQTAGAETLNVTSTGDNTADLDIATVKTLTVDGTGTITANDGNSNVSGAETITVTGSAGLNLGNDSATTALTSVDTTGTTGTVTMGIDDGTQTSYAGGAGVDNLTVENADTAITKAIDLGAGDDKLTLVGPTVAVPTEELNGGEGTDTLSTDAASAVALDGNTAFASKLNGFERLEITGATGAQAVNAANLGFADYVSVAGVAAAGTLTLNDLANNANVVLTDTNANVVLTDTNTTGGLTTNIENADDATLGTDDVLNFEVSNDDSLAVGTLTAADIETVNVTATDVFVDDGTGKDNADAAHTMTLTADTATTLNVDGSAALDLTLTSSDELTTINASEMTDGGLTVTANGANAMTITGGAGADVLTASETKADVINGGEGNDTITAGFNGASLTGGAGNDLFVVGADSETGNQEDNTYSKILDFQQGDKIQLSYFDADTDGAGATAVSAANSFAKLEANLDESTASFSNFVDASFKEMSAEGEAVWFMFGDDSYIVQDSNVASNSYQAQTEFTNGEDLIVRVEDVDLTGASFNSDYGTVEIA